MTFQITLFDGERNKLTLDEQTFPIINDGHVGNFPVSPEICIHSMLVEIRSQSTPESSFGLIDLSLYVY